MEYIFIILLGLCLGSFVNALIWRIHKQEEVRAGKAKTSPKERQQLSIVHGRSMCMHCGHELAPKDLIPVLSWISLRGKCRYCRHRIDDTPLAELILPALLVLSYIFWPYAANGWSGMDIALFTAWTGVLTCFVALSIYDAKWFLLPDRIVAPLTGIVLVMVVLIAFEQGSPAAVLQSLLGGFVLSGVFFLLSYVSKGQWIGGGDIKIGFALGMIAGSPLMALLVIFMSSLLGTVFTLPAMVTGKQKLKSMLPFGPFLMAATYLIFLWGDKLTSWYFGLFLQ
jgi:leader peptidase (prepilin peptidase)/N-methyltransferase